MLLCNKVPTLIIKEYSWRATQGEIAVHAFIVAIGPVVIKVAEEERRVTGVFGGVPVEGLLRAVAMVNKFNISIKVSVGFE
jgi:hypothetical protein